MGIDQSKPKTAWTQLDPTQPGGEKPLDDKTKDSLTRLNPVMNTDQTRETVGSDQPVFKNNPNLYFNSYLTQYGPWVVALYVLKNYYL